MRQKQADMQQSRHAAKFVWRLSCQSSGHGNTAWAAEKARPEAVLAARRPKTSVLLTVRAKLSVLRSRQKGGLACQRPKAPSRTAYFFEKIIAFSIKSCTDSLKTIRFKNNSFDDKFPNKTKKQHQQNHQKAPIKIIIIAVVLRSFADSNENISSLQLSSSK